ncbi:MAG: isochorismatase family protein [Elusimicrobia bacterium]|nr:isochorismatase family protein [Elusimicrobiota bacterium]
MMKIIEYRHAPGLAGLFLAQMRNDPRCLIEFVDTLEPGVKKTAKWVMMISTQFGCAMGCRLCDAGSLGYFGNLSASEMLEQIQWIIRHNPALNPGVHPKIKIHWARMGEPSLNREVLEALKRLRKELPYAGIMPSLSTIAPQSPLTGAFFDELIEIKNEYFNAGRLQLQFSIHSTDDAGRLQVSPVRKWSLEEIASYGKRFVDKGDRKITLNFPLSKGQIVDETVIIKNFSPKLFLVKFTPVNPTATAALNGVAFCWQEPPPAIAQKAQNLKRSGFNVIISPSLPEEIKESTSCGQLWSGKLRRQTQTMIENRKRDEACYVNHENLREKTVSWLSKIHQSRRHVKLCRDRTWGLLIVDMQNFFLDPRSPAFLPASRTIMPNVWRLAENFKKSARPIFWAAHTHSGEARLMSAWWRHQAPSSSYWSQIAKPLEASPGQIFEKYSYGALSSPDLTRAIKAAGVDALVIAGVMTNLCVESTARQAFDSNIATIIAADAAAAMTEKFHLAGLQNLALGFSLIEDTLTIIKRLRQEPPLEKKIRMAGQV